MRLKKLVSLFLLPEKYLEGKIRNRQRLNGNVEKN